MSNDGYYPYNLKMCNSECFDKEGWNGVTKECMKNCMKSRNSDILAHHLEMYKGGKRKTKSVKKTNKRRKNKRTSRKIVK
jgi:hypothetical protein